VFPGVDRALKVFLVHLRTPGRRPRDPARRAQRAEAAEHDL